MRRRGCLWGLSIITGVFLLCCVLGYFVALPRVQDNVREGIANQLSTQVSRQFAAQVPSGGQAGAGEYRLSLGDIERQLQGGMAATTVDSMSIRAEGSQLVFSLGSGGQDIEYRGVPTVNADGQLEITDMTSTGGPLDYIMPPDKLGGAIERGVNGYLEAQGLRLQDLRLEGNDLVFEIAE